MLEWHFARMEPDFRNLIRIGAGRPSMVELPMVRRRAPLIPVYYRMSASATIPIHHSGLRATATS